MKHFDFADHWDSIKRQLKHRYQQLTDDDLAFAEGKSAELIARLREKLELSAQDLDALLHELETEAAGKWEQVKTKVGELADDARAKAGELTDAIKEKAAALGDEAKAQATAAYGKAQQSARSLLKEGRAYVRHNPRQSLLAALCAGFVAGLMIRR